MLDIQMCLGVLWRQLQCVKNGKETEHTYHVG